LAQSSPRPVELEALEFEALELELEFDALELDALELESARVVPRSPVVVVVVFVVDPGSGSRVGRS
jgi:hypothetical protein